MLHATRFGVKRHTAAIPARRRLPWSARARHPGTHTSDRQASRMIRTRISKLPTVNRRLGDSRLRKAMKVYSAAAQI
jgi:hypothetical protein